MDVRVFVLKNGLQLLGELVQSEIEFVSVKNPVMIGIGAPNESGIGVQFLPYLNFTVEAASDNGIRFQDSEFLAILTPVPQLEEHYQSFFAPYDEDIGEYQEITEEIKNETFIEG